jgi:2-oxoisovalerate dehydrogenase E2 component (dihydrolipoyl transacylase)
MTAATQRFRGFLMPDVGEGLTEAQILKWYVKPGDPVTDGQVICEVETAKAAVELPIPYEGVVHELCCAEGASVDVGAPIILVDTQPGAAVAPPAPPEEGRQAVLVGYGAAPAPTTRRPRRRPAPAPAQAPASAPALAPLATPPVRKLAKDLGVDLATVAPTGPNGTFTRDDVHLAAAPAAPAAPASAPVPAPAHAAAAAREERLPVKGIRKAVAQAMVASAFTAPHVTEFVTVDVTRTVRLVQKLKRDPEFAGLRVNPLLLTARALLTAIRRNPQVNASWDEEAQQIVLKHYVNLGIAAATPRGLIVPNIKDAHTRTLPQLARELGDLVTTARENRTGPEAMRDGTVTITNIGVFGIGTGTPILNPGESAILALGAITERPWVHKGRVCPRHVTTLALSFDHRIVDGELGSRVLADTAAVLERPQRLITWA